MQKVIMDNKFVDRREKNIPLEDVARERYKNIRVGIGIGIIISGVFALILYNL